MVGTWRTAFEFDLGNDPAALARLRTAVTPRWLAFLPGTHLQIKGDRVRALVNELVTAQPTRPIFRGQLVADQTGTRLVGKLSWSLLKSYTLVLAVFSFVLLYGATASYSDNDRADAAVFVGLAAAALLLAFCYRRDEARLRDEHTGRLRQQLTKIVMPK